MSEQWVEVSDFEGRVYYRKGKSEIAAWEVEDELNSMQAEIDRLKAELAEARGSLQHKARVDWLQMMESTWGQESMRRRLLVNYHMARQLSLWDAIDLAAAEMNEATWLQGSSRTE